MLLVMSGWLHGGVASNGWKYVYMCVVLRTTTKNVYVAMNNFNDTNLLINIISYFYFYVVQVQE